MSDFVYAIFTIKDAQRMVSKALQNVEHLLQRDPDQYSKVLELKTQMSTAINSIERLLNRIEMENFKKSKTNSRIGETI